MRNTECGLLGIGFQRAVFRADFGEPKGLAAWRQHSTRKIGPRLRDNTGIVGAKIEVVQFPIIIALLDLLAANHAFALMHDIKLTMCEPRDPYPCPRAPMGGKRCWDGAVACEMSGENDGEIKKNRGCYRDYTVSATKFGGKALGRRIGA